MAKAAKPSKATKTAKPAKAAKPNKAAKPAKRETTKALKPAAKSVKVAPAKAESKAVAAKSSVKSTAKPAAKPAPALKSEKPLTSELKPVLQVVEKTEISVLESVEAKAKPAKLPKAPKVKSEKKTKALLAAEKLQVDDLKKWGDYKEKYGNEKAQPYSMSGTFEAGTPIQHKILGWGFIIQVQNDRLEVLFESGSKVLISNYKSE